MLRAADEDREIGVTFRDWGVPTAGSVAQLSGLGLGICATGGVKDGLMVAKAIALGATCGGIARPFLQAHARGGRAAVLRYAKRVIAEIRVACLLTGSRTPAALRRRPLVVGPQLRRWIPEHSPLSERLLR